MRCDECKHEPTFDTLHCKGCKHTYERIDSCDSCVYEFEAAQIAVCFMNHNVHSCSGDNLVKRYRGVNGICRTGRTVINVDTGGSQFCKEGTPRRRKACQYRILMNPDGTIPEQ